MSGDVVDEINLPLPAATTKLLCLAPVPNRTGPPDAGTEHLVPGHGWTPSMAGMFHLTDTVTLNSKSATPRSHIELEPMTSKELDTLVNMVTPAVEAANDLLWAPPPHSASPSRNAGTPPPSDTACTDTADPPCAAAGTTAHLPGPALRPFAHHCLPTHLHACCVLRLPVVEHLKANDDEAPPSQMVDAGVINQGHEGALVLTSAMRTLLIGAERGLLIASFTVDAAAGTTNSCSRRSVNDASALEGVAKLAAVIVRAARHYHFDFGMHHAV